MTMGVPYRGGMKSIRRLLPVALAAFTGAAFVPPGIAADGPPATRAAAGIDLAGMNRSVAPGDDFFVYANGTWTESTEIPADRSIFSTSAILSELTARRTAELIAEAAKSDAPAGSDARKIGDTYNTFMDEAAIEAKGLTPLEPTLRKIRAIADARELARFLGGSVRADVDVFNATKLYTPHLFGLWVAQDLDEPTRYAPFLLQGGLDMPDRDYYLDPSPRMAEIRAKCLAHIAVVLRLAGIADADGRAARIFELEKRIAAAHVSRVEASDVRKGNNHWNRQDFETRAPGLDWEAFFAGAGLGKERVFVAWQPAALAGLSAVVKEQPLETWKDYLAFHAADEAAPHLPRAFVEERFAFHDRVLTGTPRMRDRWKRAVDVTDASLGQVVGKLYVERYFPPSEKKRAEEMVKNELEAFGRRIDRLDWMAPETKAKAKAKLAVLKVGVGYPDRWRDDSGLEVVAGDALGNSERATTFEYRWNLEKLGRPVDRGEWVMNPQLVNAVNLPAMNALNFPAAILQPPNFDPRRPAAMDYGAIGATIGHEISHSFDDEGALFDAQGRLENWWTKEDFAHFEESAAQLVKQYDGYRPFPDLAVNGKLTVSENIADVAGLAVAYDAYRISLKGKKAPTVQGLTGDQQFFVAFAQSWRVKAREAEARRRVLVDSHAPGRYRADTVRNLDAWYEAFAVKPGQKLYLEPKERVRVW
jgi:predicted metalloendopeptidase